MKRTLLAYSLALASLAAASPAHAGEIFGGIYIHDVDTPLTRSGFEQGADVHLGWRGDRIGRSVFQPYVFGAVNTSGDTHYAAAGVSAKFGRELYVRPGLGVAVHTGSTDDFQRTDRIAFGSRILFQPEINVGAQLSERVSIEASWVHLSHAQLFGRQNPGIDNFGIRLNVGL